MFPTVDHNGTGPCDATVSARPPSSGCSAAVEAVDPETSPTSHSGDSAGTSQTSKNKKKKKKKKSELSASKTKSVSTSATPAGVSKTVSSALPQSNLQEELEWCIAQLELGLSRTDATKSQKVENEKFIRSLRSQKTPLPRKRQLMRNLFGDYRTRMVQEPIPRYFQTRDSVPSVSCVKNAVTESEGRFFRRSVLNKSKAPGAERVNGDCSSVNGVNGESAVRLKSENTNTFCFNFEIQP